MYNEFVLLKAQCRLVFFTNSSVMLLLSLPIHLQPFHQEAQSDPLKNPALSNFNVVAV